MDFNECQDQKILLAREYAKLHHEAYFFFHGSPKPRFNGNVHEVYRQRLDHIQWQLSELDELIANQRENDFKKLKKRISGGRINNELISRSESSTESIPTGICESILHQTSGETARS